MTSQFGKLYFVALVLLLGCNLEGSLPQALRRGQVVGLAQRMMFVHGGGFKYMDLRQKIVVGAIYQHYKGADKLYEVVAIARCSENPDQESVIYKALYNNAFGKDSVWSRPLEMFAGKVEICGRQVDRFAKIFDPADRK